MLNLMRSKTWSIAFLRLWNLGKLHVMLSSRGSRTKPGASEGGGWISYVHSQWRTSPRGADRACHCGSCHPVGRVTHVLKAAHLC